MDADDGSSSSSRFGALPTGPTVTEEEHRHHHAAPTEGRMTDRHRGRTAPPGSDRGEDDGRYQSAAGRVVACRYGRRAGATGGNDRCTLEGTHWRRGSDHHAQESHWWHCIHGMTQPRYSYQNCHYSSVYTVYAKEISFCRNRSHGVVELNKMHDA